MNVESDSVAARWTALVQAIEAASWTAARTLEDATVEKAAPEVAFGPLWIDIQGAEEDELWFLDTEPPPGVEYTDLIDHLAADGVTSWWAKIGLLTVGDTGYPIEVTEIAEHLYVAHRLHPVTATALRAWFVDYMASGGVLNGPLPEEITNGRPDLLDEATVMEGYRAVARQNADAPTGAAFDAAIARAYRENANIEPDA